jgi:hypothetical protein
MSNAIKFLSLSKYCLFWILKGIGIRMGKDSGGAYTKGQYFPKGTDLSIHSQSKLSAVARQLNERPRKTLEFETPAEQFTACVASTVEITSQSGHSKLHIQMSLSGFFSDSSFFAFHRIEAI